MRSNENPLIESLVNDFMTALEQRTGVDESFLFLTRPAVRHLFENRWPQDIEQVRQHFENLARIHQARRNRLFTILAQLNTLSHPLDTHDMSPLRRQQIEFTSAVMVNTILSTYGGFGPQLPATG